MDHCLTTVYVVEYFKVRCVLVYIYFVSYHKDIVLLYYN